VPAISRDMHVDVSAAQWMLTVNLLVGAVTTRPPPCGTPRPA